MGYVRIHFELANGEYQSEAGWSYTVPSGQGGDQRNTWWVRNVGGTPDNRFDPHQYTHQWKIWKATVNDPFTWPERFYAYEFSDSTTSWPSTVYDTADNGMYLGPYGTGTSLFLYRNTYSPHQNPFISWNYYFKIYNKTGVSYTVKYNANGGTGTMADSTATYGSSFTFRTNTFTKSNYAFSGWELFIGSDSNTQHGSTTYLDSGTFTWDISTNTTKIITAKAKWALTKTLNTVTYIQDIPDFLYDFLNHTFTTSGAVGRTGPTLAQIKTAYSSSSWSQNASYLNMYTQGIQEWTVPVSGSYKIECLGAGAQGYVVGTTLNYPGGKGARMIGTFNLTKNEVICIVVGQEGKEGPGFLIDGTNRRGMGSGGGGGSFVYKKINNVLCIVAGGGGGSGYNRGYGGKGTADKLPDILSGGAILNAQNNGGHQGREGRGGKGGQHHADNTLTGTHWNSGAGGGGGWNSDGETGVLSTHPTSTDKDYAGVGGKGRTATTTTTIYNQISYTFGPFVGGYHQNEIDKVDGNGGFGGGGGSSSLGHSGGGGGGYTGGGGGNSFGNNSSNPTHSGGQGGGSYNNGISGTQTNESGINGGNGIVIITLTSLSYKYYHDDTVSSLTYTFLENTFTKTGYNFVGWHLYDKITRINTDSTYFPRQTLDISSINIDTIIAVAQWNAKTYQITYSANGGTGTMAASTATYGSSFSFQNNSFTRTGYNFAGWFLYKDNAKQGRDTPYNSGETYGIWDLDGTSFSALAQWAAKKYQITYDANGGTGTMATSAEATYDSNFTFQTVDNLTLTRTGYNFKSWDLFEESNNIRSFVSGATFRWDKTGTSYTVKAQWTAKSYVITYYANGGTGIAPQSHNATYGSPFIFEDNSFTRTGHTFAGWSLYIGGVKHGTTTYNSGATISNWDLDGDIFAALAEWTVNSYTFTFNANAKGGTTGTGGTIVTTADYNTLVTCPTIKAVGYVFKGWATSDTSTTVDKAGGATFTSTENKTFYAIWNQNTDGIKFSELQTVFGGQHPIHISEYRTQSGQTTTNSQITLNTHLKGKGPALS